MSFAQTRVSFLYVLTRQVFKDVFLVMRMKCIHFFFFAQMGNEKASFCQNITNFVSLLIKQALLQTKRLVVFY